MIDVDPSNRDNEIHPLFNRAVLVCALGYFVDIYDLVLFSIVRVGSLRSLGFEGQELTDVGIDLLNCQMTGLLLGGILWGFLGDRRGRISILFGSIAMYSLANIANAFVQSKEAYGVLRFIAGVGLAGELGAAITLVGEILPQKVRGYSTAFIAGIGILGAILSAFVAQALDWRWAYGIGGVLGISLLIARSRLVDSRIFHESQSTANWRGNFLKLFYPWSRCRRYLCTLMVGVPCWYMIGILVSLGPEITKELGVRGEIVVGTAITFQYLGASLGDFLSGYISQKIQSRRRVIAFCISAAAILSGVFLGMREMSTTYYYGLYLLLGFATGYWAVFVTTAAEQFGTNIRATAASTAPNFVRGSVVVMTSVLQTIRPTHGIVLAVALIGVVVMVSALISLRYLDETYHRDLNFIEI